MSISVLIVDDESHIRLALEYNLKHDGLEVYVAKNGSEGIELAKSKKPDLILLDWMMPDKNGMEVLTDLKRNKKTKHIPVFMLTAKGMIGDVDKAYAMGADDYITKPFDAWNLATTLLEKLDKAPAHKSAD
jgi:two-component system phosphate regulon response regulator PhoB